MQISGTAAIAAVSGLFGLAVGGVIIAHEMGFAPFVNPNTLFVGSGFGALGLSLMGVAIYSQILKCKQDEIENNKEPEGRPIKAEYRPDLKDRIPIGGYAGIKAIGNENL